MESDSAKVLIEDLLAEGEWLHRLARNLAVDPDVADDAVQETWMAALRHPPQTDLELGCPARAADASLAREAPGFTRELAFEAARASSCWALRD